MAYWRDKVVLVTGGSSGFGYILAKSLAGNGARIALAARDKEKLATAVTALRRIAPDVEGFAADVTRDDQVAEMLQRTLERFGRLDALVNNVGGSTRGLACEATPDDFRAMLDLNLMTAVRCTRAALPHLVSARGHLVFLGSLASKSPGQFLGAYPASKFAVAAYAQQLRLELRSQGVHVLLVCPGPIAREDSGTRYDHQAANLPSSAKLPAGGVKISRLPPEKLVQRILEACEHRRPELVIPWRARGLFAISQLWPSLGDWILRRSMS